MAATTRDDVVFTHNDSGDTARFFAVDRHGCTIGRLHRAGGDGDRLGGHRGRSGQLAVAGRHPGDNNAKRDEIAVLRFDEPAVGASSDGSGCPPAAEQAVAAASTACVSRTARTTPRRCSSIRARRRSSSPRRAPPARRAVRGGEPSERGRRQRAAKIADVGTPALRYRRRHLAGRQERRRAQLREIGIRTIPDGNIATALPLARAFSASMHPTAASRARDWVSPGQAANC